MQPDGKFKAVHKHGHYCTVTSTMELVAPASLYRRDRIAFYAESDVKTLIKQEYSADIHWVSLTLSHVNASF